jgi:hypothetical protein
MEGFIPPLLLLLLLILLLVLVLMMWLEGLPVSRSSRLMKGILCCPLVPS